MELMLRKPPSSCVLMTVAALVYAFLLTKTTFDPIAADHLGLTFNSMLDHLLRKRWDVDPAAVGNEAFVLDGRSYAYFGPLPAVLRLPLVLVPHWQTLYVERLSCWMAILLGIGAQFSAVTAMMSKATVVIREKIEPILKLACVGGGVPMILSFKGALIYHEAILWAWAFAMLFIAAALKGLDRGSILPVSAFYLRSTYAGLCLLTRSITGAGLFVVIGLFLLRDMLRLRVWRMPLAGLVWKRLIGPSMTLAVFLLTTAIVNEGRWRNPFCFADLRKQLFQVAIFPDRLIRLHQYGLFSLHRFWIGFLYYVFPIWTARLEAALPLSKQISDLFDAAEQPAESIFLTDPLWCLLALCGLVMILRRRALVGVIPLVIGLSLVPALMMTAWDLAFRYRFEFAPLLFALSCVAIRALAPQIDSVKISQNRLIPVSLCALQIVGSVAAGVLYNQSLLGPSSGYSSISVVSEF